MTYVEFLENFLKEFLKIKSFAGRISYANANLTRIGSGSGRIVYDIDGEKVLKLAKNTKGIAQNEAESNVGRYPDAQDIVTEVFDEADDDTWIISEKAKKVNEKRIKELTGIPSLNELYHYVRNFVSNNNGKRDVFGQTPEMKEELNKNEFAQDLTNLIANYNQSPGDYIKPSSYGEVLRGGQPSIVLTDYGLNDEVYNTYYSPQRKQNYRMYEMYNFADGNDDILSDIDDGDEIRHGMWAIIPYGVGDGDDTINEEFVEFVENRNEYPKTAINNLPVLVDNFHECINNLKETLNHTTNKRKFYDNLLKLQEYLISQGVYNRDRLGKEAHGINEQNANMPDVVSMSLDDEAYANNLVKSVGEKLKFTVIKSLGGGSNGFAFDIGNNKIFKLTSDASEADAAFKLLGAKPIHIAAVYNIYKIVDTEKNQAFFGFIEENVENKPVQEFWRYINIVDAIMPNEMGFVDFMILMKKKSIDANNIIALAQGILSQNPEANISNEGRKKTYNFILGIVEIKKELLSYGIYSNDYSNVENLGYENGVLKFFDFGGYRSIEPQLNSDQTVYIPESVEITEDIDRRFNRNVGDLIANKVAEVHGFSQPQYLGQGRHGFAYDIGNDKIMKVTSDKSEAVESLKVKGIELEHLANIYDVFEITPQKTSPIPQSYVIISEKLKTDQQYFDRIVKRLQYAFNNILGLNFYSVLDDYLYGGYDLNKDKIDKYLLKNPEDAKFYYGLLAIADEARKYGIKSADFYNTSNLGYKKNGNLGFFDMGWGDIAFNEKQPQKIEMDEDGTSLYSTDNSIGQDGFPPYSQYDSSPMTDNNIRTSDDMYEDLEYHHVDDATQDKYTIDELVERIISSMAGSSTVNVKKKCKLAGLGNTSAACNQGDINNLEIKKIDEAVNSEWFNGSKVVDNTGKPLVVYHGTNQDFNKFSLKNAAQPIIWFSSDRDKIERGDAGAAGRSRIIKAYLSIKKMAGWNEYSKYGLGQLREMGYDGAKLDDDYFVFSPKQIKIIKDNDITEDLQVMGSNTYKNISIDKMKEFYDNIKNYINIANNKQYLSDEDMDDIYFYYLIIYYNRNIAREVFGEEYDDIVNFIVSELMRKNKIKTSAINETKLMNSNNKISDFRNGLISKPFIKSLIEDLMSDIYVVGGAVRDLVLNKPNKDIDLVVREVPIDALIAHLQKFGKVDVVGKSFGVIKFVDGDGVDYDIALPRKEKLNGEGGYRGFDVQSDENLPIEDDLIRRDVKINAIAININTGKFIDPLGGLEDIEKKQISAANPEAFNDDPLRMLRVVQFASRFGFKIEPKTMQMIRDNAERIKEIPPERILTEFDKIVKKGDKFSAAFLLKQTGLLKNIFGRDSGILVNDKIWNNVKTMGEFIYLISHNLVENPAEFYKNNLRGDIDTYKEIKALEMAFDGSETTNMIEARTIAHNMYVTSPISLNSQILPNAIKTAAQELLEGKYPKTISELAVNGNDLMQLGLKGKEIGDTLKMMLLKIYSNTVNNNKNDLLSLLDKSLNEQVKKTTQIEYGALMLGLDIPDWKKFTKIIKKDDIYEKNDEFGIETMPHLTLLYGFHDNVNSTEVFDLYKKNFKLKPIEITTNKISIFENDEFDVVKFDVNSKLLTNINKVLKELPNTSDFPEYHAHITIAYVKKGCGDKYIVNLKKKIKFIGNKLIFSTKNESKNILKLNDRGILTEEYNEIGDGKYKLNDEIVNIPFFVRKYDEWNTQNGEKSYKDPSAASVLEFLQNNYEDYSNNEKLKQLLLWALNDRDLLTEINVTKI